MRVVNLISCKNIRTNYFVVLLLFIFFSPCLVFSQSEYSMTIGKVTGVSENVFEFGVYIKSSAGNIYLTSYQCSFLFNSKVGEADRLSFTYIDSTSQLTNLPTLAVGINDLDGELKLTFASLPGLDTITEKYKCLGRFRLQNNTSLVQIDSNLTWNFEGFITTILTGELFQNITSPTFHNYDFDKQSKFNLGKNSLKAEIPNEYKLFQNYPNPFNPSTKITINLLKDSQVNLTVYNLVGQKIEVLINDRLSAGIHSVNFKGESLTGGIYFGKLKVENKHEETIKMILLK